MKIALVCKVYPSQRPGGMAFVCQDRARALIKLGHEVHVLTTGKDGHRGAQLDDEGVEVHHMPCASTDYSDEFASHLVTHVKRFAPDILHLDSFDVNRPWWRDVPKGKTTFALTMHGFCWGAYFTQLNLAMRGEGGKLLSWDLHGALRERSCMLNFDTVIGISIHERWMMQQLMGIHDAKLVYNPIPEYFFSMGSPPPPGTKRFLCAAISSHGTRGLSYAEKAAKTAGMELVVARTTDRHNMPSLIDTCHGLVLPTAYAQGLDLTVGEAIIRGRSVIATATGSYLREAQPGGIYHMCIDLVPLVNPVDAIIRAMQNTDFLTTNTPDIPARRAHYPSDHVRNWLKAILG